MTLPAGQVPWAAAVLSLCLLLFLLRRPAALLLRLMGRSALGLAVLALLKRLPGISLGVNPLNALVLGLLGAPGLGLLLLLQWFLK